MTEGILKAQLQARNEEIAELRAELLKAASIARDSIDAIEQMYTSMTAAISDALPVFTLARQQIATWEGMAKK